SQPGGSYSRASHTAVSQRIVRSVKGLQGETHHETVKAKRRRAYLRPDFYPGALGNSSIADVPVAVGNVVEPELPADDAIPLWSGSRAARRRELPDEHLSAAGRVACGPACRL